MAEPFCQTPVRRWNSPVNPVRLDGESTGDGQDCPTMVRECTGKIRKIGIMTRVTQSLTEGRKPEGGRREGPEDLVMYVTNVFVSSGVIILVFVVDTTTKDEIFDLQIGRQIGQNVNHVLEFSTRVR